jgi:hypothetical protein
MWALALKRAGAFFLLLIALSEAALAHGAERGFVMLLPTGHFILGGAAAVLVSFLVLAFIPAEAMARVFSQGSMREPSITGPRFVSGLSFLVLLAFLCAGFAGSRDPLANPLPLVIWTFWWVVLVLASAVFGNLWRVLNPFTWAVGARPRLAMPRELFYAPAFFIFLGFSWFQLISPAPDDPQRLAFVVSIYGVLTLAATFVFGAEWFRVGDPFTVYFRLIGQAAPFQLTGGRPQLQWPGAGLGQGAPLPMWGILFVLLTLSAISFDGFQNSFFWVALGGANPLEFPGRTALQMHNMLGFLLSFAGLAVLMFGAVYAGALLSGTAPRILEIAGRVVMSLIPISIAFHFAHYLPDLLVSGQYLLVAFSDPLSMGWDLLGLGHYHVTASFLNTASGAQTIYALQTVAIVLGHVIGVAVGHRILAEFAEPGAPLFKLEAPLALLMVAYTAFGLWMLSSPSVG